MSNITHIFIWKKAPFLRLLIPVIAGIVLQFLIHIPVSVIISFAISLFVILVVFSFLSQSIQFRFKPLQGILISLLLLLFGAYLNWYKDIRNNPEWYGHFTDSTKVFVATVAEPLQQTAKSFKAIASVERVIINKSEQKCEGKLLIYFSKG